MEDISSPRAVIVLGSVASRVGRFVEENLLAVGVVAHFADSTEEFCRLSMDLDDSRVVLIEPDWDLMLKIDWPNTSLFVVWWRGATWTPPWEDAGFEVRDPYVDSGLFQRHVLAWLLGRGT